MTDGFHDCFRDKVVLVTGGAGSLGRRLVTEIVKPEYGTKTVRVLDISENSLAQLKLELNCHPKVRWFLGNISDKDRMVRAMENVDIMLHLAAQKHVDLGESNPFFCIQTNVVGTQNCIEAALACNVDKFLFVSSDKAVQAVSTYGRCKALSESLTLDANSYKGDHRTIFSVVRPPNYVDSDGSIFDIWAYQKKNGLPITVTSDLMTRYFMTFDEIILVISKCLTLMKGGEVFVPTGATKYRIIDLAKKMQSDIKLIGVRPGEKLDEKLIDETEISHSELIEGLWVIR